LSFFVTYTNYKSGSEWQQPIYKGMFLAARMKTKDEDIQEHTKGAAEQLARLSVGSGLTARSLEVFVSVARAGTMSAAAEQLGMTQPAVSQLVSQMETALDVQLFDRSKRPLVLTLHGAALLEPARAIVSGIERFEQALQWDRGGQMPLLRIGMLNSFAETIGPSVFTELRRSAAQLTIGSGFSATRMRAVADRELDFVITSDESPLLPGVTMAPILTEPFLIVAPESYKGDLRSIKTLSETLELIRFGRDPFMHSRFDQTLRAWGISPTHHYHLDTHAAVLEMVASGVGWTILPPLAVYRAVTRGERFRVAPYPEQSMKRVMMVIAREGEGAQIVRIIHAAASEALNSKVLPVLRQRLPEIAAMMKLHDYEGEK
jgi:DNA-binding transcriptional LysR family regulator